MKIAYWSNIHGQTATTSNLLATVVMSVLYKKEKNAIMQSHFSLNNLDTPLMGKTDLSEFNDIGIDALIRDIKSAPLDEERVYSDSISFLNKKLSFFPGTKKLNREVYEKDMLKIFSHIMNEINPFFDNIFVDVNAGTGELAKNILDNSDLIVVNLSQNISVLNDYVSNYNFEENNVIYLIGSYHNDSRFNIHNLTKLYHSLTKKNTMVIPYNVEYMDAFSQGNVNSFFMRNQNCTSDDPNYYFIEMIKRVVDLIDCRKEDILAVD